MRETGRLKGFGVILQVCSEALAKNWVYPAGALLWMPMLDIHRNAIMVAFLLLWALGSPGSQASDESLPSLLHVPPAEV